MGHELVPRLRRLQALFLKNLLVVEHRVIRDVAGHGILLSVERECQGEVLGEVALLRLGIPDRADVFETARPGEVIQTVSGPPGEEVGRVLPTRPEGLLDGLLEGGWILERHSLHPYPYLFLGKLPHLGVGLAPGAGLVIEDLDDARGASAIPSTASEPQHVERRHRAPARLQEFSPGLRCSH